jgi:hypothetical protein
MKSSHNLLLCFPAFQQQVELAAVVCGFPTIAMNDDIA